MSEAAGEPALFFFLFSYGLWCCAYFPPLLGPHINAAKELKSGKMEGT
jgi:hypothetical protein